jgi:hypothetical protein
MGDPRGNQYRQFLGVRAAAFMNRARIGTQAGGAREDTRYLGRKACRSFKAAARLAIHPGSHGIKIEGKLRRNSIALRHGIG